MAVTDIGAQLTAAHRSAQVQIAADTITQMRTIWPLLDPTQLDATTEQWLEVAIAVVQGQRQASTELAATYMEIYRQLELGTLSDWVATHALGVNLDALRTSLRVTGPVRLKTDMGNAVPLSTATDVAEAASAAAAMRHALNGGRETIWTSGNADRKLVGYMRVTSGNPCAFCAMLASRGAVYFSEDTAGFQPHDGCACFPEPLYGGADNAAGAADAADWQQLWQESTQGTSGQGSIRAFRRAYDARNATTTVA